MRPRQRVSLAGAGLAALVVAGALFWSGERAWPAQAGLQGAALWRGTLPLTARIAGHAHALPPVAARCINCHGGESGASASASAAGRDPLDGAAPVLTARHLREPTARRGGPPSRYDAAAFCTLLRTGVDPASVLLPRHMPRYEITAADCDALWIHLTEMPA